MTLRALRAARWARTLLLAAAVITTAGSFGLHPEPESALPTDASASGAPSWTAVNPGSGAADGCTACLSHRTISFVGLAVFSPAGAPVLEAPPGRTARRLRLFEPLLDDGRAPPTLL